MSADLKAVHSHGNDVNVAIDDVMIARYVYRPDPEPFESPKPYLHPLRTLAGDVVTGYRPNDHRWHKGLQLTATDLSGHNLWGGNTYVDGTGYVRLDNVGAMRPDGPVMVNSGTDDIRIDHKLTWTTAHGEVLAAEDRELRFHGADPVAGWWLLDWVSTVRNESPAPLVFGSPATNGLRGSGYAGLLWRGPRAFTGGQVISPSGPVDADDFRGKAAPWLAYVGEHDDVDRHSTLVFAHNPANEGYAAHWFVRSAQFAAVNPSWAFYKTFTVEPDASFSRAYRVAVMNGAADRDGIAGWFAGQSW